MNDRVYFDADGNIVVTGVRLVCSNTLVPACPECGCSYFIDGDKPGTGLCHDCGKVFELTECGELRRRAEKALGWAPGASKSFSFPTLREFVKAKSAKLHYLMGLAISAGKIVGEVLTRRGENKS